MRNIISILLFGFSMLPAYGQDSDWTFKKISPNVFLFQTPGTISGDLVQGNCTVIEGKDGLLIVDTFGDPVLMEHAMNTIKKITTKPVRYIVNTHWHYDHVMGNAYLKRKYPDAKIIAQSFTAAMIKSKVENWSKNTKERFSGYVSTSEKAVQTGIAEDSTTLTNYERTVRYPHNIALVKRFIADLNPDFKYTPVDMAFTDSLKLWLGNEEAVVFNIGVGNTKGDAMVYLPSQKILLTGDIVVSPIPYAFVADQYAWTETLKKIKQMNVTTFIPGHGEPMSNSSYIDTLIGAFSDLIKEVENAVQQGQTLDEAQKNIKLLQWQEKMAGNDEEKNWAFKNFFVQPAIASIYKDAKAKKK